MSANNHAPRKPVRLHFKFDNFKRLPSRPGQSVKSEVQTDIHGNKWYIELFPGGEVSLGSFLEDEESEDDIASEDNEDVEDANDSDGEEGQSVSYDDRIFIHPLHRYFSTIYVMLKRELDITYKADVLVLDRNGNIACERPSKYGFGETWTAGKLEKDDSVDFFSLTRVDEKKILRDGALFIDVVIQFMETEGQLLQIPSRHASRMLKLLESGEKADASFVVGDKIFNVHSQIIHANAPILSDFLEQQGNTGAVIEDIHPEVFHIILKHIYTGVLPEMKKTHSSNHPYMSRKMFCYGKKLINAANRFELTDMKMAVENVLVGERILTRKNVSDYMLFADAQSCPLLKEYAISYFLLNAREVLQSKHSKRLRESVELLSEIITLQSPNPHEIRSVTELKKELMRWNLDVDGSKEMLIERLAGAETQEVTHSR